MIDWLHEHLIEGVPLVQWVWTAAQDRLERWSRGDFRVTDWKSFVAVILAAWIGAKILMKVLGARRVVTYMDQVEADQQDIDRRYGNNAGSSKALDKIALVIFAVLAAVGISTIVVAFAWALLTRSYPALEAYP